MLCCLSPKENRSAVLDKISFLAITAQHCPESSQINVASKCCCDLCRFLAIRIHSNYYYYYRISYYSVAYIQQSEIKPLCVLLT